MTAINSVSRASVKLDAASKCPLLVVPLTDALLPEPVQRRYFRFYYRPDILHVQGISNCSEYSC